MAMAPRLNEDDDRRLTERTGQGKQDLAADAFGSMIDLIMDEHTELMRRLA
ncbi:hypothetical protein [Nocardia rhizosphaerae]|uniref:Uncharacterized protein n=1 Tax=Nocardia rhizosphaerae TaxID=1691571 RepID=A0ABV8L1G1_9NOCA